MLLHTFKIDWILIIKFDTSNMSITNLIHQTCVVSSASTFHGKGHNHSVHVFTKSDFSVFEMMLSHNRV